MSSDSNYNPIFGREEDPFDDIVANGPHSNRTTWGSRLEQTPEDQDEGEENKKRNINEDIEIETKIKPIGFFNPLVLQLGENHEKWIGDGPLLMWQLLEEGNKKWVASNLGMDVELADESQVSTDTAEPSDDLIVPLLRYQKEWLAWALKQEDSHMRGGILADEMGMGKTLQAIALVLLKRNICGRTYECGSTSNASSLMVLPPIKGTLVVCPVFAVMHWVSEIDRFTAKGSTKVLVYHGANRGKSCSDFPEYGFIITTYSTIEAEYRRYALPPKVKCLYCRKPLHENRLFLHMRKTCAKRPVKTASEPLPFFDLNMGVPLRIKERNLPLGIRKWKMGHQLEDPFCIQ